VVRPFVNKRFEKRVLSMNRNVALRHGGSSWVAAFTGSWPRMGRRNGKATLLSPRRGTGRQECRPSGSMENNTSAP